MPSRYALPLLFAAIAVVPRDTHAAVTLWTTLYVRLYDAADVPAAERDASLQVAASIVSAASIDVVWTVCERRAGHAPARRAPATRPIGCEAPMRPGELAVRMVRSPIPHAQTGVLPLGDAMIDAASGAGVLATVYADRVTWMAAQTGVERRVLLGRAIAHELGHLLMATSAHGTVGLMRPVWSRTELRRARSSDWTFGPGEVAAISARVRAR